MMMPLVQVKVVNIFNCFVCVDENTEGANVNSRSIGIAKDPESEQVGRFLN